MQKFTIYMADWYRGRGVAASSLLRPDGSRCCLGFIGQQCGLTDAELQGHQAPYTTKSTGKWPSWFWPPEGDPHNKFHSSDIHQAMHANDDMCISDETRIILLKEIFALHDTILEFVPATTRIVLPDAP